MGIEIVDAYLAKIEHIDDREGSLEALSALNQERKFALIAPNHTSPKSRTRYNLASADDYGTLYRVLEDHGIKNIKVVFRGDADMELDTSIRRLIYSVGAKISHNINPLFLGGIPIHINIKAQREAQKKNIRSGDIKRLLEAVLSNNIVIYPYGNWFKNGEQDFYPEFAYDTANKRFFDSKKDGIDVWHDGIKPGFAKISKRKKVPILPVYVYQLENRGHVIFFGKMIIPDEKDVMTIVNEYLNEMVHLKESTFRYLSGKKDD